MTKRAEYIRKKSADNRASIADLKLKQGCSDCGFAVHAAALDFDHRPGEVKKQQVSWLMLARAEVLQAEIAKCDVVCANCHRVRTFSRRPAIRSSWYETPGCCKGCNTPLRGSSSRSFCKGCNDECRWYRRQLLAKYKIDKGCADCGYAEHGFALDFDHRPGEEKLKGVAVMLGWSWDKIMAEVLKCDVVCANCHRIRTHRKDGA